MAGKVLLRNKETKPISNERMPLISESMRKLLPPFPFVPTKPRTPRIHIPDVNSPPMAAGGVEEANINEPMKKIDDSMRRKNTPHFEFDLNLPPMAEEEEENQCSEELMANPRVWGHSSQASQSVIMAVPQTEDSVIEMNKKRKKPSKNGEFSTSDTKMNKKRRILKKLSAINNNLPAATKETIEAMGGYSIKLMIQKVLTDTDVSKNHGRLSLPPHQLRDQYFLTTNEEALLKNNEEDKKKKGMTVRMFDGEFKESSMRFKKWKIGSRQTFCLMTEWNSFVEDSHLKANDEIQLWSFRVNQNADEAEHNDSNLCFIVIKILKQTDGEELHKGEN